MLREIHIRHEFVEFVPSDLDDNVLYISMEHATAVHKCCCGCGNEVVTPITPTDWKLMYNGDTVSLDPSIGNWSFDCQSHYWIRGGKVVWAERWSSDQISMGRSHDRYRTRQYHDGEKRKSVAPAAKIEGREEENHSIWKRIRRWF